MPASDHTSPGSSPTLPAHRITVDCQLFAGPTLPGDRVRPCVNGVKGIYLASYDRPRVVRHVTDHYIITDRGEVVKSWIRLSRPP